MKIIKKFLIISYLLIILPFSFAEEVFYKISLVEEDYTLNLEEGRKTRLIGLELPSDLSSNKSGAMAHSFQKLSFLFIKSLIEGKKVRLEFDKHGQDRFNRELVYVFLEDGTLLNDKIIKEGYAQAVKDAVNTKYKNLFLRSEDYARENKKGLWKVLDYVTTETNFMKKINMSLFNDGVYLGSDTTPLGEVGVEVVLRGGKIKEIEIVKNTFSHCGSIAESIKLIPQRIIDHQTLDVDSITGATVTSNSIKYAIFDALKKSE